MSLLPSTAYQPPQVGRSRTPNVIATKKPAHVQLPSRTASEIEDDQPTPRGVDARRELSPARSEVTDSASSACSKSTSSRRESVSSFNSLYDVSDDDSFIVPIRISNSIKKNLNTKPKSKAPRVPSLIIPESPSGWPTIHKLKAAQAAQAMSARKTPLSPQALLQLATQSLQLPDRNATPSLAESMASEELASMSPCTPASGRADDEDQWDMPVQLHPTAMCTLQQISYDEASSGVESAIELTNEQAEEMQDRGLNINIGFAQAPSEEPSSAIEPISAISVPSPGGFFASLTSPVKNMWGTHKAEVPTTSTAENFYNLPFDRLQDDIVERVLTVASEVPSGPPTAHRDSHEMPETPTVDELVVPANRVYEYDEHYENTLHKEASSNLSRTSLWLRAQNSYLSALSNTNPTLPPASSIRTQYAVAPSVRSASAAGPPPQRTPPTATRLPPPPPKPAADPLFYHAFQHFLRNTPTATAFTQRHLRLDALTTQRRFLHSQHLRQLTSSFNLPPAPSATASTTSNTLALPDTPADPRLESKRLACATADRERAAQSQIQLNLWTLQATRFLAQGRLLPSVADKALAASPNPKVLDLGGNPTADWAWALAWESRNLSVTTVVFPASPTAPRPWEAHRNPSNHRVLPATNPWTLPFPDAEFDVISARTLHTLLHVPSAGPFAAPASPDEWSLTFRELRRVLKPGGILSYETLDAAVVPLPGAAAPAAPVPAALAARSSAFLSLLATLRVDPVPSVSNVARLHAAGFTGAKEQVIVNMALAGRADERAGVEALTGLVGSIGWERWMAGVQGEAGMRGERVLGGVAAAMEGAGKEGGRWGWRVGRGWCRK